MAIEIRQEEHGDVRLLALSGRLDTETSADLELALQDLKDAGATRFVIDLGEIGYVSSAGLRVLLALAKQLDGGRGSLKLCALNDAVRQVFDVAGFSRMFAIFPNRDVALGAAAKAPAKAAEPAKTTEPAKAAELAKAPPRSEAPLRAEAPAKVPPARPEAPAKAEAPPSPAPVPGPSELTRQATALLGAEQASPTAAPETAALARSAAELLGAVGKEKAAAKVRPEKPKAEPAPKPAAEAPKPAEPAETSGVLGKFRNLFGKK
jgi:anti-sigma B factor antagonist